MFVLDTNVVSELRKAKAGKANKGVVGWARRVPAAALMFLSVVALQELEHGVLLVQAATLHVFVPDPAPVRDAVIGATALVHGMTVVTRNTTDFERYAGLKAINPWA
jgi:toxin FitB